MPVPIIPHLSNQAPLCWLQCNTRPAAASNKSGQVNHDPTPWRASATFLDRQDIARLQTRLTCDDSRVHVASRNHIVRSFPFSVLAAGSPTAYPCRPDASVCRAPLSYSRVVVRRLVQKCPVQSIVPAPALVGNAPAVHSLPGLVWRLPFQRHIAAAFDGLSQVVEAMSNVLRVGLVLLVLLERRLSVYLWLSVMCGREVAFPEQSLIIRSKSVLSS